VGRPQPPGPHAHHQGAPAGRERLLLEQVRGGRTHTRTHSATLRTHTHTCTHASQALSPLPSACTPPLLLAK
jgi:hypothetical protein